MSSAELNIRMEDRALERLDELARVTGRTKAAIAADAIDAYLDIQHWQIRAIEKGLKSLDAGKGVPHENVEAWARALTSENSAK